jgi:AcrR family transcriptional regulator
MPRKKRDSEQAKQAIVEAAVAELSEKGAATATVEAVAKRAGCAKGLVLYHFKTKQALFESAGAAIAATRAGQWSTAFEAGNPTDAIDRTWALLTKESTDGVTLAWSSLLSPIGQISDQAVKGLADGFASALGTAGMALFESLGTEPRVNEEELGWLLASIVTGMEAALSSGADPEVIDGAYTAAWLGVLSLARSG